MIIGTCLQTLILVYIVYKTNWNKEVSTILTLPDSDFVDMYIIAASMFMTLVYCSVSANLAGKKESFDHLFVLLYICSSVLI